MSDAPDLTDLHLMILGVLWRRRRATIGDIHEALRRRSDASRKTIATLLSRLEKRGLVRHESEGRESVYRAVLSRRKVLVARMIGVLGALFEPERLSREPGVRAVDRSEVRRGDVARLRALLARARRDLASR